MAINMPSGATGNGGSLSAGTTKRRGGKKSATASSRASKASQPAEILFKEPPNPYRTPTPPYIWIDHPQANERLRGPAYVIRLGVGGAEAVELSIDRQPWVPCRFTSGYWWYDWSAI